VPKSKKIKKKKKKVASVKQDGELRMIAKQTDLQIPENGQPPLDE